MSVFFIPFVSLSSMTLLPLGSPFKEICLKQKWIYKKGVHKGCFDKFVLSIMSMLIMLFISNLLWLGLGGFSPWMSLLCSLEDFRTRNEYYGNALNISEGVPERWKKHVILVSFLHSVCWLLQAVDESLLGSFAFFFFAFFFASLH